MTLGGILCWVPRSMHTGRIAWGTMKRSEHVILTCKVHPSMFTLVIMKSAPVESVFGNVVNHISSVSAFSDPCIAPP